MNVQLTPHAAELLKNIRDQNHEPLEVILEQALEALAKERDLSGTEPVSRTSVLDLEGLGREIWQGLDAQEYVNQERAAWNG